MTSTIDFGNGQPSLSILPMTELRTATEHCFARGDASVLQYGTDPGDDGFRAALAEFLTRRYGAPIHMHQLMVSAGISQALDLVCTRFTKPGDTIFVEAPTYFLALDVFRDHGLNVVGIPIDNDGLRIDALKDALTRHRPVMLYTIPTFQNPTGVTMSAARREQLLTLSREHELLIVADEVYQLLDFGTTPPKALATLPGAERVLSLGSFSKICAPGLRLGWIHGDPALLHTLMLSGVVQSGGGLGPFASGVMHSMMTLGLADQVLDGLKRVHAARATALCDALREHLPTVSFVQPLGGYFVWLQLPTDVSASALLERSSPLGVTFHPGTRFVRDGQFTHAARLSFAHYETSELIEGVRRMAHALG